MPRELPVVAIDGPAGAGKSTVARRVAEALGFTLVDTGALYRTVAIAARAASVSFEDVPRVEEIARAVAAPGSLEIRSDAAAPGGTRVVLDGEDLSAAIREPEASRGASAVSALPGVRAALLEIQRANASKGGVVLEGRDIGTVVVPDAEAKFFVTASPEVRARRRFEELRARGSDVTFEATLADVISRDHADATRAVAPLIPAHDAVMVDTSTMSIDDVVAHLVSRVRALLPS